MSPWCDLAGKSLLHIRLQQQEQSHTLFFPQVLEEDYFAEVSQYQYRSFLSSFLWESFILMCYFHPGFSWAQGQLHFLRSLCICTQSLLSHLRWHLQKLSGRKSIDVQPGDQVFVWGWRVSWEVELAGLKREEPQWTRLVGHLTTYQNLLLEDLLSPPVVFLLKTGVVYMSHRYLPSGYNLQRSHCV